MSLIFFYCLFFLRSIFLFPNRCSHTFGQDGGVEMFFCGFVGGGFLRWLSGNLDNLVRYFMGSVNKSEGFAGGLDGVVAVLSRLLMAFFASYRCSLGRKASFIAARNVQGHNDNEPIQYLFVAWLRFLFLFLLLSEVGCALTLISVPTLIFVCFLQKPGASFS